MEIEETFVPGDTASGDENRDYCADNDHGERRYSNRRRGNRGGYQPNTRYRRPQTDNGVILQVELDRDLLSSLKEICGEKSIFWGIREACYQFVKREREGACDSETF